jgi:hypothetical protein
MNRTLTKSRFKLACECPTKLYYTRKKDEYADQSLDDSFLQALAEGGFQVGELAKCYYPGGHDITTLDAEEALAQTNALLELDEVVIFEAAVRIDNLFIRIDILKKMGNHFKLVEVKAKSWSGEKPFVSDKGKIKSDWRPYLEDVAFQKHVVQSAFPESTVSTYLMMADKKACCSVEGLHQKFRVVKADGRQKGIKVSNALTEEDLRDPILIEISTDDSSALLFEEMDEALGLGFRQKIQFFSDAYAGDERIASKIGRQCSGCQFKASAEDEASGLKSGFKECWKDRAGWSEADFADPTILDLWNLNYRRRDKLFASGCLKMKDVEPDDIGINIDDEPGITASERQWLQVEKVKNGDDSVWVDGPALRAEMDSWEFPLNFIDFETAMPAIPFHKGLHPYEGIAFQFSHHTVSRDGTVAHVSEYLNGNPGEFPNYEFLRALKASLEANNGTIFRYSNHENTYLNMIVAQLTAEPEGAVPDRDALIAFTHHITQGKKGSARPAGARNMVDLWDLVKRFYYAPATQGSNSIKAVLPAILNSSDYLKNKYAQPVYGADGGIMSLNFRDWAWVEFEADGKTVIDPYKRLPPMFSELTTDETDRLDLLIEGRDLQDGGAAMMAYAKLQFTEMSAEERQQVEQSLLRYCELDTLAMVMIYEGWVELLGD